MKQLKRISNKPLQPRRKERSTAPLWVEKLPQLLFPHTSAPLKSTKPLKLVGVPSRLSRRVLDFDLENRPLSYLGSDFTTADITSIAWGWTDEEEVHCELLTTDQESQRVMLERFLDYYNEADVVTGHYIRKHDLPIINGALMEWGLPLLQPKLTSDTKLDLVKRSGISASQESLADMYDLGDKKYHMGQIAWRKANRLTPAGMDLTRKRVCDDIVQHKALRAKLIEAGALGPPKMWRG